ncbi:MAG: DUF4350 domain-containing protein [Chloroflexota bacterium]
MIGRLPARSRWSWTGLALLAAVLAVTAAVAPGRAADSTTFPALSIHSDAADGARALDLWLSDLGYAATPIEYQPFAIDPTARLLFVLEPDDSLSTGQVRMILDWVRRGGRLVLVSDQDNPLYEQLGVRVAPRDPPLRHASPLQPLFRSPPVHRVAVDAATTLRFSRPSWVPSLGGPSSGSDVIAAEARLGGGLIFVSSAVDLFSNDGLAAADNWAVVANLLAPLPPGSTVVFDEYHHGLTESGTLGALLVRKPWGWAIIYLAIVLFAYVAASGRRFGRALGSDSIGIRRARGEYVATLAVLLHQGRDQEWLRKTYLAQVRRSLGTRFGVRTDQPAREFVSELSERRPGAEDLGQPLRQLESRVDPGEAEVVALMARLDKVSKRLLAP